MSSISDAGPAPMAFETPRVQRRGARPSTLVGGAIALMGLMLAGGVFFISAATDKPIKAIDSKTGERGWSPGDQAAPIADEQDGNQYLLVIAGGHHFMMTPPGDPLIAYVLPDEK